MAGGSMICQCKSKGPTISYIPDALGGKVEGRPS